MAKSKAEAALKSYRERKAEKPVSTAPAFHITTVSSDRERMIERMYADERRRLEEQAMTDRQKRVAKELEMAMTHTRTTSTWPPSLTSAMMSEWISIEDFKPQIVATAVQPATPSGFANIGYLVEGHRVAAASEAMVTLQIETDGILIMAQDGDGYVTETVEWRTLGVSSDNPIPAAIARLEKQLLTRGRLEAMVNGDK